MAIRFITGNLKDYLTKKNNFIKTPNHGITPNLDYYGTKTKAEFNGSCSKQVTVTFNHKKEVNIYIAHEISKSFKVGLSPSKENSFYLLE